MSVIPAVPLLGLVTQSKAAFGACLPGGVLVVALLRVVTGPAGISFSARIVLGTWFHLQLVVAL